MFHLFLNKKINFKFSNPDKFQIVLFDGVSYNDLKYVLEKYRYKLIENRKERVNEIYCSFDFIFKFISNFFFLFLKTRNIHTIYLFTLIKMIDPKIIITSIDNSAKFHDLAKLMDEKINFIAVQNASRSADFRRDLHRFEKKLINKNTNKDYYIPNYFCYGQNEIDDCDKYKIKVKKFFKIGSVRVANFFRYVEQNKIILDKNKFDLCLISEPSGQLNEKLGVDMINGCAGLAKYTIKFARKNKIKFIFAQKQKRFKLSMLPNQELNFFKNYLSKDDFQFLIENMNEKTDVYSSYIPLFQSRVAVGTQSTLLKDKISCKEKILSLNLTQTNIFDFPIDGICTIKNCTYEQFEERLINILEMSNEEYFAKLTKHYNYVIEFDKNKSVIEKIQENLKFYL